MLEEILALINTIWGHGQLPKEWKHSIVVPIQKPGKTANEPGSYRPIALTAVICKIMERMVTHRLVYMLEKQGYFVPYQSGFRVGRSTMDSALVARFGHQEGFIKQIKTQSWVYFSILRRHMACCGRRV